MNEQPPHPEALENSDRACIPERKVRYPLKDPDKRMPFEALGFSEQAGNWKDLRDAILENLPFYPAQRSHRDRWGATYNVDILVRGPSGEEAPVRTKWIYGTGEDQPRITTLYVKTTEWRRRRREEG